MIDLNPFRQAFPIRRASILLPIASSGGTLAVIAPRVETVGAARLPSIREPFARDLVQRHEQNMLNAMVRMCQGSGRKWIPNILPDNPRSCSYTSRRQRARVCPDFCSQHQAWIFLLRRAGDRLTGASVSDYGADYGNGMDAPIRPRNGPYW